MGEATNRALAELGVTDETLTEREVAGLDQDGYAVLRGLIPPSELPPLRARFEALVRPFEAWPYPRQGGFRFAMLDGEEDFLSLCLAPRVLACVHHLFQRRFYLGNYEGREPLPGDGHQSLHRDGLEPAGTIMSVSLLLFFDKFDRTNGATRLVPQSHITDGAPPDEDPREIFLQGEGGDGLVFPSRLIHAGSRNETGAPRRTLIAAYHGHEQFAGRFFKPKIPDQASPALRYVMGG